MAPASAFRTNSQAVTALKLASPQAVVKGIWAFLRTFTTDTRFADDSCELCVAVESMARQDGAGRSGGRHVWRNLRAH